MDTSTAAGVRRPIVLVAANGQLGAELHRELGRLGEVIPTARTHADAFGVAAHRLDLTSAAAIRQLLRDVQPGVVVNAAAYTAVDRAEADYGAAEAINAVGVAELAAAAQQVGAVLVHFSTDYVFDGSGTRPWTETDPTTPVNAYGRSKLAGEQAIRASGVAHLIIRTSWLYGACGANFVKTMLRLAARYPVLRVVCDQTGSPTSAAHLATAVAAIMSQAMDGGDPVARLRQTGGTLHLACSGETTWHGFATAIFVRARQLGFPVVVEEVQPVTSQQYAAAARRPSNSRLDCLRAEENWGVKLPKWELALDEVLPQIVADLRREFP